MTRTIAPTPMAFPNKVTISIYNSAGELVKNVFNGSAQYQPGGLNLDKTVVLGGSNSVFISFPGYLDDPSTGQALKGVSWGAINNNGQGVASGVYTIKAEIVDEFGQVTSLEQSISVMDVVPANKLTIYNSAGEVVADVPLPSGGTGRFSSLRLESDKVAVDIDPKTGTNLGTPLVIWVTDEQGNEQQVQWDGRNAQGLPVTSGTYIAELIYGTAGTRQAVSSKSFTVLQAGSIASLAGALVYPNPVLHGADFFVSYSPSPGSTGLAHLYDLNGGLVAQAEDSAQVGVLKFRGAALAGGVYIVRVEKLSGGGASLAHTLLKIAVIH
jgi:flagellar hook assembly protein FlgD